MVDWWPRSYLSRRGGAPNARRRDGRAAEEEALAGAARRREADERSIDLAAAAAIVAGLVRREEERGDGFRLACARVTQTEGTNVGGPFIGLLGPFLLGLCEKGPMGS